MRRPPPRGRMDAAARRRTVTRWPTLDRSRARAGRPPTGRWLESLVSLGPVVALSCSALPHDGPATGLPSRRPSCSRSSRWPSGGSRRSPSSSPSRWVPSLTAPIAGTLGPGLRRRSGELHAGERAATGRARPLLSSSSRLDGDGLRRPGRRASRARPARSWCSSRRGSSATSSARGGSTPAPRRGGRAVAARAGGARCARPPPTSGGSRARAARRRRARA